MKTLVHIISPSVCFFFIFSTVAYAQSDLEIIRKRVIDELMGYESDRIITYVKDPAMFRKSNAVVINKADLLPYCDFDMEAARRYARQVNPDLEIHELSARTNQGIEEWVNWLVEAVRKRT